MEAICPLEMEVGRTYRDRNPRNVVESFTFTVDSVRVKGVEVCVATVEGDKFTYGGLYPHLYPIG